MTKSKPRYDFIIMDDPQEEMTEEQLDALERCYEELKRLVPDICVAVGD